MVKVTQEELDELREAQQQFKKALSDNLVSLCLFMALTPIAILLWLYRLGYID